MEKRQSAQSNAEEAAPRADSLKEAFWAADHILIAKGYRDPAPHAHLAKHLIVCVDGMLECVVGDCSFPCRGVCIDSNVTHTVRYDGKDLLVFLFGETSHLARELESKYLSGAPYCLIGAELADKVAGQWKAYRDDAQKLDASILSAFGLSAQGSSDYDMRIRRVLKRTDDMEGIYENTIGELSDMAALSQSRLSHLFKEQVGVSLCNFLIFEKMRKTHQYIMQGDSLTTACVRAGFSSSSHFSNVCRRMFGLTFTEYRSTTACRPIV